MKLSNVLNPFFLYNKRQFIIPHFIFYVFYPLHFIFRKLAIYGFPITKNEKALWNLKEKHVGSRCFIIGNGPSLKINDLDKLRNEITFASNKIYLAFDQTDWKPTYYSVEDYLVFEQNYLNIMKLKNCTKIFPIIGKKYLSKSKDCLFFNLEWKDFYPNRPRFGFNILDKLYWGSTITYTCIQLACYMGIKEIYLIGVDFHFDLPAGTLDCNEAVHISENEKNHFHPDYRKPGEKWCRPNLELQEKSYEAAKYAFEKSGGKIYNATRGGKLEIFPRVDFDSLF